MSFFLTYRYSCPPNPSPHPTGVDWPVNLTGNLHVMEGYVTFAGHRVHKALFDSSLLALSLNASGWQGQTYDGGLETGGQMCLGPALSSWSGLVRQCFSNSTASSVKLKFSVTDTKLVLL